MSGLITLQLPCLFVCFLFLFLFILYFLWLLFFVFVFFVFFFSAPNSHGKYLVHLIGAQQSRGLNESLPTERQDGKRNLNKKRQQKKKKKKERKKGEKQIKLFKKVIVGVEKKIGNYFITLDKFDNR